MTSRISRRVAAALLAAGMLALTACGSSSPSGSASTDAGYQSQDGSFTSWPAGERQGPVTVAGTDYAGTAQDTADWLGDVVVLNTWYAACPPCREEAPDLVELASEYADQGLHVLGINGVDDAGAAESFQRTFDVPYPSIDDRDKGAIAALQGVVPIQATPTTVVLDREGKVFARIVGMAEGSTLRALVEEALAEDPA
ncbi:TlpA family protein disulfide reductase [Cellulomonas denverensis]|uniref:TlpA family protein disulfide reductase n=1 Tax=Cellulomonas denverensis TaxID=264297 RepID=A0A7X6KST9_9CELL|nr:TlpA disulfide reductase family protein [Cellulomonas denverensis]NKY21629.1 TlpA family protein disulfide reductase [Cellulomonas denverensis]GIG25520.1 thiol-disulfide isomerase [Cellulomonas denverensis]